MPPKSSNDKSAYKGKTKLDLEKLIKNGEIQAAKIDLHKITINKLAKRIGVLSGDIKMYMCLPNAQKYYALNDRTINLLMKSNVGMSATTDPSGPAHSKDGFSDAEVREIVKTEQEVELFTVDKKDKSRWIILSIS